MLTITVTSGNNGGGPYFSILEEDEQIVRSKQIRVLAKTLVTDYPDQAHALLEQKRNNNNCRSEILLEIFPDDIRNLIDSVEDLFIKENSEIMVNQDEY